MQREPDNDHQHSSLGRPYGDWSGEVRPPSWSATDYPKRTDQDAERVRNAPIQEERAVDHGGIPNPAPAYIVRGSLQPSSRGTFRAPGVHDFLDSDRAKRHWGHWRGVRCVIAYSIWFVRFRNHPARRKL